jgi:hypothetical protein
MAEGISKKIGEEPDEKPEDFAPNLSSVQDFTFHSLSVSEFSFPVGNGFI